MKERSIKIQRARAGLPRSYSDSQFKEILKSLGSLPSGKVIYQGDMVAFLILGEESHRELAGMWRNYMQENDLENNKISRPLALLLHVEGAAHRYRFEKLPRTNTPHERGLYFSNLEKICKKLMDKIEDDEVFSTDVKGFKYAMGILPRVRDTLEILQKETRRQIAICPKDKISRTKRRTENAAFKNLIASLYFAWEYILCRKVTSGTVNADGKAGGPLIRFIQTALLPLEIEKSPNAVREALKDLRSKQK